MKSSAQIIFIALFLLTNAFCMHAKASHNIEIKDSPVIQDTIKYPWNLIDPTSDKMKPGYPFAVKEKNKNSLLPYIIGIPVTGGLVYFITKKDEASNCDFNLTGTKTDASCDKANGSASVVVDQPGTYAYTWSNGITTASIQNLAAGQYTVTVTPIDSECSKTLTLTISNSEIGFQITLNKTDTDCNINNGTATVSAVDPGTYNYLWSTGDTDDAISNLAAGNYSVTVSQSDNCFVIESFTINQKEADFQLNLQSTPSVCTQMNGSVAAWPDPPGEYTYLWSDGSTDNSVGFLSPGEYEITVTDANGCTKSGDIEVQHFLDDIAITVSQIPAQCGAENGSAQADIYPFSIESILWSDGSANQELTDIAAGDYAVTVTNTSGCTASTTFTIDEIPADIDFEFNTTPSICDQDNGSISVQLTPEDQYDYLWSSGATTSTANMLTPGSYTLTVTNQDGCSASSITSLTSTFNPIIFDSLSSMPGNCLGGGEIAVNLLPVDQEPLILELSGPDGMIQLTLPAGQSNLSDYTNILPGDYTLVSYDQGIGNSCIDSLSITVFDTTTMITLVNDTFTGSQDLVINGNVLINDTGLSLNMIAVDSAQGGMVNFVSDGTFAFTPEPGFSGTASFLYTAADTCNTIDTAMVSIFINDINCEFEATFDTTPASCGSDDGQAIVSVTEPGNYQYIWDNGHTGPVLSDVFPGIYSVSITDVNLNCTLIFETTIDELPPEYITELEVQQASCTIDANIIFELLPSSTGSYDVEVFYPDGDLEFTTSESVVFLGDYVPIIEGDYTLTLTPTSIGYPCTDGFVATIDAIEGLTIEAVDISPTSSPSASDGEITIEIVTPGTEPYTVLIDGDFWATVTGTLFTISGLPAADYTIQIIDNEGCTSNELVVTVPFQTSISFSNGLNMQFEDLAPGSFIEHISDNKFYSSFYTHQTIINYSLFGFEQESVLNLSLDQQYRTAHISHLITLWDTTISDMHIGLLSGFQTSMADPAKAAWQSTAQFKADISDELNINMRIGFNLNENAFRPTAQISIRQRNKSGVIRNVY